MACPRSQHESNSHAAGYPYIEKPGQNLEKSDSLNTEVQSELRQKFLEAVKSRKWSQLRALLGDNFQGRWPRDDDWLSVDGDWVTHRKPKETIESVGPAEFVGRVKRLFNDWASFGSSEWRTFDVRYEELQTANVPLVRVAQKVHLLLTGRKSASENVVLRGTLKLLAEKKAGVIRIKRLVVSELHVSTSTTRGFEDLSSQVGFDHFISETDRSNIQKLINERELTATGGITVLDFDSDDYLDLLVSHPMRGAALFVNDRHGGFTRSSPEIFKKGNEPAKFFISLDFDNDGYSELVSTRPGVYSVKNGEVKPVANAIKMQTNSGAKKKPNYEGITSCDLNNDGLLDFILAGYSHEDSPKNFNNVDSHGGLRNLVFINKGNLRFEEQGLAMGISETRYTFVGECYDFDQDGDLDLYFGNDYGPNEYYENQGNSKWLYRPEHPLAKGTSFSMGLSIADFNNTGEKWLSVSNMYSHAGSRIVPYAKGLSSSMRETLQKLASGNTLYKISDSSFPERAQFYGIDVSDWAWGNIFFDVDNDGDKDLYVVNGYTSHQDTKAPDF